MSDIQIRYISTGVILYFIIVDKSGKYYNTNTQLFETLDLANWEDYDLALTETPASSYFYVGTFPATISLGQYFILVFERAGASPAISDVQINEDDEVYWNETELISVGETVEKNRKVLSNKVIVSANDTSVDVYEDDDATVAFSFTVSADRRTRIPV